jgi:hypothetical protein
MNEAAKTARDMFESNRSAAAMLRDSEAGIARRAVSLLDLRTVPREEWDRHLNRDLLVPEGITRYLAGELTDKPPAFPLTGEETDGMGATVERFHGITAPYFVNVSLSIQHDGRAWAYVPEAAPYLSGFYLDKEKA